MTGDVYAFGPYLLDVEERRLCHAGEIVPLAPKAFDVLVALVRRAGTLVTKRELLDLVWRDVAVEEGVLSVYVSALRKSLGESVEGAAYIETVPRAGYRFWPSVTHREASVEPLSMKWPIGVLPAKAEVSELIGRGRACLMTASQSEIPRAVAAFRSAIELDPDYAAAHAGLAVAHCAEAELRLAAPDVAYAAARAAALRALAMEAQNADAQVALGTVLFLSDWNWNGAQRSLERALELNEDHTEGWLLYGRLLEALGYLAEGLAAKQRVLERDPSSSTVHLQIALSYWNQRRYDDMISWATRSLELNPHHLLAREYPGRSLLEEGRSGSARGGVAHARQSRWLPAGDARRPATQLRLSRPHGHRGVRAARQRERSTTPPRVASWRSREPGRSLSPSRRRDRAPRSGARASRRCTAMGLPSRR